MQEVSLQKQARLRFDRNTRYSTKLL